MTEAWKQYEGQIAGGSFHLRKLLGSSYGSAVFLTERSGAQSERAAIKLVIADPATADQQLSRWRAAAKLSHPNLLRLYEMGRSRLGDVEVLYVVMEFAEEDVSQILPHRALTPEETRDMLAPLLEGLAYLHAKGFVHGHLKPTNISAVENQIKISADGIRGMGEARGGQQPPSAHDPPEAATEKAAPAADVWSLGMTLVEVLTQRLPVWERIGQKDPQIREAVPAPLLDIARNCLRRDPRSRLTLQGIAARLQPGARVAVPSIPAASIPHIEAPSSKPQANSSTSNYLTGAVIAVALAAALIFGITRFAKHSTNAQPDLAVAADASPATAEPKKAAPKEASENRAATQKPVPPPVVPSAETPQPKAAPAAAGAIVQGEVLRQLIPDVPQQASGTISGTVKVSVRVSVDPSGNVAKSSLDAPGPSKYFANLALQASRRWTFSPAKADGQAIASEWLIRFEFTHDGAKAFPSRSFPK
jgi:TonB family protein